MSHQGALRGPDDADASLGMGIDQNAAPFSAYHGACACWSCNLGCVHLEVKQKIPIEQALAPTSSQVEKFEMKGNGMVIVFVALKICCAGW